jgi:hypothetical protein
MVARHRNSHHSLATVRDALSQASLSVVMESRWNRGPSFPQGECHA